MLNTNSKFDQGVKSYDLNLNSQNGILGMSIFVQNMRVHNMKSELREKKKLKKKVKLTIRFQQCLAYFNKGILICNSSLKNLFLDL